MPKPKRQEEMNATVHVTSRQLITIALLIGLAAGMLVSIALGSQNNLKGGAKVWQGFLFADIVCFITVIGYLQFKYKRKSRSVSFHK